MRILSIDYGDSRVGIAVSDPLGITAQGVETIQNTGARKLFARISELLEQYKPETVVVGMPKNMNGTMGERAQKTNEFVERLGEKYNGRIELWDERLTTVGAIKTLNETNTRGKKRIESVDTVAAVLILQGYLDKISR